MGERKLTEDTTTKMNFFIGQLIAKLLASNYVIFIVLIAYISNLISGFCFAWSSPVLVKLNETQNNPLGEPITPDESDLIGSLFYVGAAIGPLLFMKSLEKLGRKPSLILMGIPLPIAFGVLAVAKDVKVYYICRIILGCVVGGIMSTVPVYVAEIAPVASRGSLMSLSNTFIQSGFLLTYFMGPYLSLVVFNTIIALISLVYVFVFTFTCPESPYHAMKVEGRGKSKEILENLRQEKNIENELNDIEQSVLEERENSSWLDVFTTKQNLKAFFMATILLIIQQFTGIPVIIGYSQLIFLGMDTQITSEKCSIIVGCLQVASSFISPLISDRFPRKKMLYFSLSGLALCNFIMSMNLFYDFKVVDWLPLFILVLFVIFDNCGNGPLPWVILGEIYPTSINSVGPAISTSIYYLIQFLVTFSFNKIELKYMFFGNGICCILGTLYIKFFVTETNGKTLREIQQSLDDITA